MDTFPGTVPKKLKISRLVDRFRDIEILHRLASNTSKRANACIGERGGHFQHLTLFIFYVSSSIYFLTNRTSVRNGLHDFPITSYNVSAVNHHQSERQIVHFE
jgi:hypothetical protein